MFTQQEFALVEAVEQLWIELEQVALPKIASLDLALAKRTANRGAKMASIEEAIDNLVVALTKKLEIQGRSNQSVEPH